MKARADAGEICRALGVLFGPGPWQGFCAELRAPGTRMGTIAGYFDDPEALADWAAKLSGGFRSRRGETIKVEGVYVTLNPLRPDLLARCANRCQPWAKATAGDADALARRWLPLDFDPERPSGISSTDREHELAVERARRVRGWLRELGWPEPILADSGNGAHLLYRIDLANDGEATDLVRRVVETVAALYGGDGVSVDQKVFNAGRIWKLYGTLAAKGDDLPERPHRLARLLEVPEPLEPVPEEALRRVADLLPRRPEPAGSGSGGPRADFDVRRWLEEHGQEVVLEREWQGGRLYALARCPWKPEEHANRTCAFVVQWPDGRVAAKCHHNSCAGKGWRDLRDLLEPGWREKEREKRPASGNGRGSGRPIHLPGRVAAPPGWDGKVAAVTMSWGAAREAYREGKAVVVAYADGAVPPEAAVVLRTAERIEAVGTDEERAELEWNLAPLLAIRAGGTEEPPRRAG